MVESITPDAIRELRRRLGLTQAAFAAALNAQIPGLRVTQVTVARWETGKHTPSPIARTAIALIRASRA